MSRKAPAMHHKEAGKMLHGIEHRLRGIRLFRENLKRARGIRLDLEDRCGELLFRRGRRSDLRQVEELYSRVFRIPMPDWLRWTYMFRMGELASIAEDSEGRVAGFDLYMFQEAEFGQGIVHELYLAVDPSWQGRGISTKLRRYSARCYDHGVLQGISTLALFGDIKALRSAQGAGFAITKASAKPPAHYLFLALSPSVKTGPRP